LLCVNFRSNAHRCQGFERIRSDVYAQDKGVYIVTQVLGSFSMTCLVCCFFTVLFVDTGWASFFGNYHPTYEAAIAYGVLSIACTSFMRILIDDAKSNRPK
jgi:hypothetical protein